MEPININKAPIKIKHSQLHRFTEASNYKSECPVCKEGMLLMYRNKEKDFNLEETDRCTLCGQTFIYEEIAVDRFTCPFCNRTSYNKNDIEKLYCGNCHEFVMNKIRNLLREHDVTYSFGSGTGYCHTSDLKAMKKARALAVLHNLPYKAEDWRIIIYGNKEMVKDEKSRKNK